MRGKGLVHGRGQGLFYSTLHAFGWMVPFEIEAQSLSFSTSTFSWIWMKERANWMGEVVRKCGGESDGFHGMGRSVIPLKILIWTRFCLWNEGLVDSGRGASE